MGQAAAGASGAGAGTPTAGTSASVAGRSAAGSSAAGAGAAAPKAGASGASVAGSGGSAGASVAGSSAAGTGSNAAGAPGSRCPAGPFAAPVPAGASAVRVEGVPPQDAFNDNGNLRTNVEGPVWIAGKLYFSEFPFDPAPKSRILAFEPASNAVSIALASSGSNGLAVDASGALVAADHELGAIVRMTLPLGTPEVVVGDYEGKRFNSPNDLAIRSDGTIYFSDPDYQAPASHPQTKTRLYRIAPGAKQASMIDDTRSQPNGVTLSADENTLYVSGADGIYSYSISANGEIAAGSGKRINTFGGSADGLGMDCAGNLYATSGQRIVVLDASGKEIGTIAVSQAESVTNVAFGGVDRKTLFITSMGTANQRGLFRVELNVPGLPY
jgi:gluconolactonase